MALKEVKKDQSSEGTNVVNSNIGENPSNENKEVKTDGNVGDENTPKNNNPQMVTLSMEDLQKMFSEQEAKLREDFNARISNVNAKSEVDKHEVAAKELIDDYLPEPVVFFAYSYKYVIMGDVRRGKESLPPHGKAIKFKPLIRTVNTSGGGRGTTVTSVCAVSTHSASERDWLRSSPYYGLLFHESFQTAIDTDHHKARLLVQANNEVQQMSDRDVINRMAQYQMPLVKDVDLMRQTLTSEIAKRKEHAITLQRNESNKKLEALVINPHTGSRSMHMEADVDGSGVTIR